MRDITRAELERFAPRPTRAGARQQIWDAYAAAICSPEGDALLEAFEITAPRRWQQIDAAAWPPNT